MGHVAAADQRCQAGVAQLGGEGAAWSSSGTIGSAVPCRISTGSSSEALAATMRRIVVLST